jgi:hypothetical protein
MCDTFWRLYSRSVENLTELVNKHQNAMGGEDRNSTEMLAHEIAIAEASLANVREELRRHELARHANHTPEKKTHEKEREY